eukprot:3166361-Rhodomonas_salina.2
MLSAYAYATVLRAYGHYALALRCPVLTSRTVLPGFPYRARRFDVPVHGISLRVPYMMPGTVFCMWYYRPTRVLDDAMSSTEIMDVATSLRVPYAMCGYDCELVHAMVSYLCAYAYHQCHTARGLRVPSVSHRYGTTRIIGTVHQGPYAYHQYHKARSLRASSVP